jgi:type IV pilus biogenesis protein PilP
MFLVTQACPAAAQGAWSESSEQLAARLQRLLDDLNRSMEEVTSGTGARGAGPSGEIEEMLAMQRRLRMMELRQREAQIIAELATALRRAHEQISREDDRQQATQPIPAPAPVVPSPEDRDRERNDYRVLSLSGSGGSLRAVIWSSRFGRLNVSSGTRLPDGAVVSRVEPDAIWIRRPGDTEEVMLGQGGESPAASSSPIVTVGPTTPPLPLAPPPPPPGVGAFGPPGSGPAGPFGPSGPGAAPRPPGGSLGIGGVQQTAPAGGPPGVPPSFMQGGPGGPMPAAPRP